ncbi:MAG: alpha-ketoacid dehydrogenase subunit beta [Rickettsiales bacterium]|nr:alpha-ketoacid dehydrogenase subunit beta [Rickettsiales bacterium]
MSQKNKFLINISYADAILNATKIMLKKKKNVFVFGQGVDDPKGHYGTTLNLHKDFGKSRCFDTPICEESMTGVGIGAAIAGMNPILVHQRMDFLMLAMNQLVNMASKIHYISDGKLCVPLVVRACIGRSWGQGAQHSQSLYSIFAHIPGLKVIAPTTPHDVKGTLIRAIEDRNPVIFIEHRMLYKNKGLVPNGYYKTEFGKSRVLSSGNDITLVGISFTVIDCINAKNLLVEKSINAEVIDLLSIQPLDMSKIISSVRKTKRLVIVENDWINCGISAEIISRLIESCSIKFKVKRLGYLFTPCPTTASLEDNFYPNPEKIAKISYEMVTKKKNWVPKKIETREIKEFKGPF